MAVVEVDNLTKIYGYPPRMLARMRHLTPEMPLPSRRWVRGVDHISLSVGEGEVFGLLGPNGSGKTTLVKLILDIIRPTGGKISVMGHRPGNKSVHKVLGYLPEQPYFYYNMNSIELLRFYGRIYGLRGEVLKSRISENLELVGLTGAANRSLRSYSKGMLQRIGLAQALMSNPRIVFLDEPSTGLDPIGRKQVKDIIVKLKGGGTTVFFNTHILSDVEDVADRVAIIHKGHLVRIGPVSEMTVESNRVVIRLREVKDVFVSSLDGLSDSCETKDDTLTVFLKDMDKIPEVVRKLAVSGADIFEVRVSKETLEDVFVREVTNGDRVGGAA